MSNKNVNALAGAVAGVNVWSKKEYRIGITDSAWTSRMAASSIENGIYVGSWNEEYGCYQLTLGVGIVSAWHSSSTNLWNGESYSFTIPLIVFEAESYKQVTSGVTWNIEYITSRFTPTIDSSGKLSIIGYPLDNYNIPDDYSNTDKYYRSGCTTYETKHELVKIQAIINGTTIVNSIGWFASSTYTPCLSIDTSIILSDYRTKLLQDITLDDELLVWNFDEGRYDSSSILWITPILQAPRYYKVTTNTGRIIKCIGPDYTRTHRVFSLTKNRFEYPQNCIGDEIYTTDGIETIVSGEWIEESINYRNVITKYHMNSFGNSILTSCGLNNIYPIKDMKFIKEKREIRPKEEFNVKDELYYGLRLQEQYTSKKDILNYIEKLNEFGTTK